MLTLKNMNRFIFILSPFITPFSFCQVKILFDATKAESACNADWVIDADNHNLGFRNGPAVLGAGSESNPQRYPTPSQTGITATTDETYWNGALSAWAIDCVKQGYTVETLPYNGQITYNVHSNPQDLSNYKIYVIVEPNIPFTASEKDAIVNFVSNGRGLCIISDHDQSDRNNDNFDSPNILNDLMANNQVQANPFGITFDYTDISQTSYNIAPLSSNSILHGSMGNVTQVQWSGGTTMRLDTTQNTSVADLVYKTSASATGSTNALCASAVYNNGKVVAIGDSSIPDDGTGDSNDTLYNGYYDDANGNHQKLLMNAILWLATPGKMDSGTIEVPGIAVSLQSNPLKNRQLVLNYTDTLPLAVTIYDIAGRLVASVNLINGNTTVSLPSLTPTVYFYTVSNAKGFKNFRVLVK